MTSLYQEEVLKKLPGIVIFFVVLAGGALTAQTESPAPAPVVRVYLGPAENGTEGERGYFRDSLSLEFSAAGYQVVEDKESSDYNVTMEILRREPDSAYEVPNSIRLTLFETGSGREVISQTWDYGAVTEMNTWNSYAVTQMMANAPPIITITPDAQTPGEPVEPPRQDPRQYDPPPQPNREPAANQEQGQEQHKKTLYLGLRAGGTFGSSFVQNSGDYEGGIGRGFGSEGGLLVEFHLLRFLSLQTEAVFLYDTFMANKIIRDEWGTSRSTGMFQHLSLMLPLWIKLPVTVEGFALSPFAGAYYLVPLDAMASYTVDPPLGLSGGLELGIRQENRMLFFSLRFDHDMGLSAGGEDGRLYYSRERLGLFVGYKFSLWMSGGGNT